MNAGVVAGMNDSGFHGYPVATFYPGWGDGMTQGMETVPEPAEQAALADPASPIPETPVDGRKQMSIWALLGGLVILILLFGKGG